MSEQARINVILPAGGRIAGEFAAEAGAEIKALITLNGQSVLERMVRALRDTGRVGRIVVIGPEVLAGHPVARLVDGVVPEGDSGPENFFRGLDWLAAHAPENGSRVLLMATDLPFVTAGAISAFLDACPPDGDICLPVIRREAFQARFPGSVNQYVSLRDGAWTIGCAFLVNPAALRDNRVHIEHAFAARKSQPAMARLLGLEFIVRFVLGRLDVEHIERRCGQILRCRGRAVHGCPAELAFDIDLPGEYRYAAAQAAAAQPTA